MAISSSPAESDLIEMIIEDEIISFSRSLLMQSSHFFRNTFKDGQAKKKRVLVEHLYYNSKVSLIMLGLLFIISMHLSSVLCY